MRLYKVLTVVLLIFSSIGGRAQPRCADLFLQKAGTPAVGDGKLRWQIGDDSQIRLVANRDLPVPRNAQGRVIKFFRESLKAYQVDRPGTADVEMPFAAVTNEQLSASFSALDFFDIVTFVFRGYEKIKFPGRKMLANKGATLWQANKHHSGFYADHRLLMQNLYERYARSEEEISSEVSSYAQQDDDSADRVTHFVLGSSQSPLAHVQAQISRDASELLNVERDFPGLRITRTQGPTFEVGRARILAKNARTVFPFLRSSDFKETLPVVTYLKIFNWLNSDVGAGQVVIHANAKVRAIIERTIEPVKFDDAIEVTTKNGKKEWVLIASRDTMLKAEEVLQLKWIKYKLKHLEESRSFELANHADYVKADDKFLLVFRANELAGLRRLGYLSFNDDQTPLNWVGDGPASSPLRLNQNYRDLQNGENLRIIGSHALIRSLHQYTDWLLQTRYRVDTTP